MKQTSLKAKKYGVQKKTNGIGVRGSLATEMYVEPVNDMQILATRERS